MNLQRTKADISKRLKTLRIISVGLLVACLVVCIGYYVQIMDKKSVEEQARLDTLGQHMKVQVEKMANSMRAIEPIVESISEDIFSGVLTVENISDRVRRNLEDNTWMSGLGVAFEPYQSGTGRLWSRYYTLTGNNHVQSRQIIYDYTRFEQTWYRKPLLEGRRWNEPYFDETAKTQVVEFAMPFWLPDKNPYVDAPSGVVFGNISAEKVKQHFRLDQNQIAYYYIFSSQGRFLIHPDEALVLSGETVFEYAWRREDPRLTSIAIEAIEGKSGYLSHVDPETKNESWVMYQSLGAPDWALVVVIDKDRLVDETRMRKQWFIFVFILMVVAICLSFVIGLFGSHSYYYRLILSMLLSAIISGGVVGLWKVAERYPDENESELRLMNSNVLSDFKNKKLAQAEGSHRTTPTFVETGVYLQSVEFEGANNIMVSGYVWHNYKKGEHKGIPRGFVLPEAETPNIEEVYRDLADPDDPDCLEENEALRDCEEVVGWYLFANLRQEFDYSLYPLDSQQVWLKLWHKSFRENIILVPDLGSYTFPNPKLAPGVQQGFVLPGWTIEESWFSVSEQTFSANFGNAFTQGRQGLRDKPELYFNVHIQREFLNPFVARVIPVVLIAILMFLIVLISTKSSRIAEWLGFTASDVVIGLSALFFVVGINHSELRQYLPSSNIMYFEYFYFVIYFMLLYVAVSAIFIAKSDRALDKEENYLTKIMYWPALSWVLFLLTFGVFY